MISERNRFGRKSAAPDVRAGAGSAGWRRFGLTPVGLRPPSVSPKRNIAPPREGWGIFNRHNGEFSTGIDTRPH